MTVSRIHGPLVQFALPANSSWKSYKSWNGDQHPLSSGVGWEISSPIDKRRRHRLPNFGRGLRAELAAPLRRMKVEARHEYRGGVGRQVFSRHQGGRRACSQVEGKGLIMGYAEKRGDYWRGRYKISAGKYGTVSDANGNTMRFRSKREAKKAADDEEAKVRGGTWRDPAAGKLLFGDYASRWYAAQDLAASTMQNYRRHLEEHLLPEFGARALAEILRADIDAWARTERERGYAESNIKTWRGTLNLVLADAVDEGLIDANPATQRRGRGKRAGRSRDRGPEKVISDPLGVLLIAERASLLSGRDDEFVALVLMGFTGMRWGELVGLETDYARQGSVRVEWQLYELDSGELWRCPPKDDSYRTIDIPPWLSRLVFDHLSRAAPTPCACHGRTYVFRGHSAANGATARGPKLVDVARRAEVSAGTVSNELFRVTVRDSV